MLYDFDLKPENEKRMFAQKTIEEMQQYLSNIPHYKFENRLYYIFKDNEWRDIAIPGILSRIANNKNIYTHPTIELIPTSIIVSALGDNDVDRYLYDFVVWCQERYSCKLHYASKVVSPEDLLSEEEEIPLID